MLYVDLNWSLCGESFSLEDLFLAFPLSVIFLLFSEEKVTPTFTVPGNDVYDLQSSYQIPKSPLIASF